MEQTTTTRIEATPALNAPVQAIVKKHMGDTTQNARDAYGEGVHAYDYTVTDNMNGHSQRMTGTFTVGAEFVKSSTTALPLREVIQDMAGALGAIAPHILPHIVEVAHMRNAGMSQEDCEAYYIANGVNLKAPAKTRGQKFIDLLRATTKRVNKGRVQVR